MPPVCATLGQVEIISECSRRTCPQIFVVDEHADALEYWQKARPPDSPLTGPGVNGISAPFTVLHFDSHADMHIDWTDASWTIPGPTWLPPPLEALQARIQSEVNISNFQPAAIFTGLVDAVVWIRSDFASGKYNGPAPGHYRRRLGLPDYSQPDLQPDLGVLPDQLSEGGGHARPLLCVWEVDDDDCAGGPFHVYGEFVPHEHRRLVKNQRDTRIPLERNTAWEDMPKHWQSGRPPSPGYSVEFHESVMTRAQFEAPEGLRAVKRCLRINRCKRTSWILDIDLDYFATFCPYLSEPIRKHGWSSRETSENFAHWAIPFRTIVSNGLAPSCEDDLFDPSVFARHTAREITQLAMLPSVRQGTLDSAELLSRFRAIAPNCSPPIPILEALARLLNGMSEQQRTQWSMLDGHDWHSVMQPHGPHHFASLDEIIGEVQKLAPLLGALPHAPTLVTIARSSERYLPCEVSAVIEWEVLMLIRRIWPAVGAGPPPEDLTNCCSEDVTLALQGVHFHTTQSGQRLRPQPWLSSYLPGLVTDLGIADNPIPLETDLVHSFSKYAVVGSWSGWSTFLELVQSASTEQTFNAEVEIPAGHHVEFQIVCNNDWDQRFFPAPRGDGILGPSSDGHGHNWCLNAVSNDCTLKILWQPQGQPRVMFHSRSKISPLALKLATRHGVGTSDECTQYDLHLFNRAVGRKCHVEVEQAHSSANDDCAIGTSFATVFELVD